MGTKKYIQLSMVLLGFLFFSAFKTNKPAYLIYNKEGKKVKYQKIINEVKKKDVVFFGEKHTNPISHWLQYEVAEDLITEKNHQVIIGAEMFETDNQLLIDEYFNDVITEQRFEAEARMWSNYETDYEPLVDLAKDHNLPFVATNVPRRYASLVYQRGFSGLDSLTAEAKQYVAPLPVNYNPDLPGYKKMITMDHRHRMDAAVSFFPQAQAVKDATMAWFINENLKEDHLFFHINGTYHSDNFEGIVWHLKEYNPEVSISTITTVEQEDITELEKENEGIADYIIVVPNTMTKTH